MLKITIFLSSLVLLTLTACGGAHIYVEDTVFGDYGYFGDDVAGLTLSASHVELGIGSGNFYTVDPQSLQVSFNSSANFALGNKNCNAFEAEPSWYEFGLAFRFTFSENRVCPREQIGFPENVYLDDIFEIESYIELGRQRVVLYSETQDVVIYLD